MQTAACRVTTENLLTYLEQPDQYQAELAAAIDHLATCPDCQRRLGYLAQALTIPAEDILTCQECQDLLPDYVEAEAGGEANQAAWQAVAQHLATCPHCASEYAILTDLAALAYGEQGEEPPGDHRPDLSFLDPQKVVSPPQSPGKSWHYLDELGRLVIEFSNELLGAWQSPAFVAAGLKSGEPSAILYQFSLTEAVEDLEVKIGVEAERGHPAGCVVNVEVNIPSRGGWPNLAGTEVTIKKGELKLATQLTDAFGQAIFEKIAVTDLPQLVFEITPDKPRVGGFG